MGSAVQSKCNFEQIHSFVSDILGEDVHAKRVYSLANATLGVMAGASLAVHSIGQALAQAKGLKTKHAIKQIDRLLSNQSIDVWSYFQYWVPYVVGAREEIMVALDWTEFDTDDQSTIALNMVTQHGRATPLLWKTVVKSELKDQRNHHEDQLLLRLRDTLPNGVSVTVLADRGFCDQKMFSLLHEELGFNYVIRIRNNVTVTNAKGHSQPANQWVGQGGRARCLRDARVTQDGYGVPTVVCVHAKGMKEPWCLVSNSRDAKARALIDDYAKRWSIETNFRDTKDLRFGMGMKSTHIKSTERRDRLFLISAMAIALLTLLGAAGESLGYDRMLKANTSKKRTHSLFRQGCMLYELIPNMPEERLRPLIEEFGKMIYQHEALKNIYGVV